MPNTKNLETDSLKPKNKVSNAEDLVDMSDFDPLAAQHAHRSQIAADYGESILAKIDGKKPSTA